MKSNATESWIYTLHGSTLVAVYVSLRKPQKVYLSDTHTVELRKRHGGVAASIRKVYLHR